MYRDMEPVSISSPKGVIEEGKELALKEWDKAINEFIKHVLLVMKNEASEGKRRSVLRWHSDVQTREAQKEVIKRLKEAGIKAKRTWSCWITPDDSYPGLKIRW